MVRLKQRRPGNIEKEAIVTFSSKEVRDTVRGAAYRLASSPTRAGIRLEVPDFLQKNFRARALENIAYRLKRKYKTMKRNIKLDDSRMDVQMDVKLEEAGEWSTILPEHAIEAGRSLPEEASASSARTLNPGELADLLNINME